VSKYLTALFAVLLALPLPDSGAWPRVRPTLLRIRVVLTTQSPAADLTFDAGTIINASVVSNGQPVRVRAERSHLSFTHDGGGPAEAHVRLLVSGLRADARVRWRLTLSSSDAPTQIEVYNENEQGRARLVDRFDASTEGSIFESPAASLLAGGPVEIGVGPRPLVLAFFYPWYQHFNWLSDRLLDQPLYLYSTELPDEVARSLREARAAGLDGVIVSWGGDTDWNDRRLRFVFDQAQTLGLTVSILVETLSATEGPDGTKKPLVADKMRRWLEKAFDAYTSHPAFLKLRGRPVIFVYAADSFPPENWRTIVQSLEHSGRKVFLMADSRDPTFLESFSGAFTYATASISQPDLKRFYSDQALRTQSYNLLYGGERRVDAATVSPGYNDSLLGRETTSVVDRANGGLYEAQWQAAVAAQPDWILVTSWNEFWENTHIEPSALFGRRYRIRTRAWSELFRGQGLDGPAPSVRPQAP
jgi:hypothetical protein